MHTLTALSAYRVIYQGSPQAACDVIGWVGCALLSTLAAANERLVRFGSTVVRAWRRWRSSRSLHQGTREQLVWMIRPQWSGRS